MNSSDGKPDLDQLYPPTSEQEVMWAEAGPGARLTVADAAARLAEIRARKPAAGTADGTDEGREYGPMDCYRQFEVTVLDDSSNVYRGFGMTLARVVVDESARFARRFEGWESAGGDPAGFLVDEPDRVVWCRDRVRCVLRPMAGGVLEVLMPRPAATVAGSEVAL